MWNFFTIFLFASSISKHNSSPSTTLNANQSGASRRSRSCRIWTMRNNLQKMADIASFTYIENKSRVASVALWLRSKEKNEAVVKNGVFGVLQFSFYTPSIQQKSNIVAKIRKKIAFEWLDKLCQLRKILGKQQAFKKRDLFGTSYYAICVPPEQKQMPSSANYSVAKKVHYMEVAGSRPRRRPRTGWLDRAKQDMVLVWLNSRNTGDQAVWRQKLQTFDIDARIKLGRIILH